MSDNNSEKINEYFNVIYDLVQQCGVHMNEGFNSNETKYKQKSDFYDLVSEYDNKIEDIIINGIQKLYPEHKFIAEEEQASSGKSVDLDDAPTWIIDPIDGTTNFLKKIPEACISVALAIKKEIVIGIVYNPMQNSFFSAKKGQGAFLNGIKINVSTVKQIKNTVLGYEISLIHAKSVRDKNVKRIYKLASNCTGTRCIGSAALSLCYVAAGRFDAYHIDDLQPWDIAAGAIILTEAGGFIRNSLGGEFNIMKPNLVAASTWELSNEIVDTIKIADSLTQYNFE